MEIFYKESDSAMDIERTLRYLENNGVIMFIGPESCSKVIVEELDGCIMQINFEMNSGKTVTLPATGKVTDDMWWDHFDGVPGSAFRTQDE